MVFNVAPSVQQTLFDSLREAMCEDSDAEFELSAMTMRLTAEEG